MLVARVLRLEAEQAHPYWPEALGHALRSAVLRALDELAPAQATGVHGKAHPAMTVAPVQRPTGRQLEVRITVLQDDLLARMGQVLEVLSTCRWLVDTTHCRLVQVLAEPTEHPLAGYCQPEELWDREPVRAWGLRFLTPTTFKLNQVFSPLPFPRSLWGHWQKRWNDLYPPWLIDGAFLDHLDEHVQLTRLQGEVLPTGLIGKGPELHGFVGEVELEARHRPPVELLRTLSRLADFAFYSGTGYQTMAGLGLTLPRRLA